MADFFPPEKSRNTRVVIVNAYGRSNRGDCVLLDECIAEVQTILPNSSITAVVYEGFAASEAIHPHIIWTERIGNTCRSGPIKYLLSLTYIFLAWCAIKSRISALDKLLPQRQRDSVAAIRAADMVISAPGGYLHDTNFAYYIALFHIHLGSLANATVVLAPQSVGPIDSGFGRLLARRVLRKTFMICARESFSYEFLTGTLSLPSNQVYPAGDSAFWNDCVNRDAAAIECLWKEGNFPDTKNRKVLGITVVDWNFPKSINAELDRSNYIRTIAQIIDHFVEAHDMIPIIFNQVSDDIGIALEVASEARSHVHVDSVDREPCILRALISKATVFVGTRFHSCIFAMMAGRPTFAIAYLPKTSNILIDLGLQHRETPIDALSAATIIASVEKDLSDLNAAESEIAEAVARYRSTRARLSDLIDPNKWT